MRAGSTHLMQVEVEADAAPGGTEEVEVGGRAAAASATDPTGKLFAPADAPADGALLIVVLAVLVGAAAEAGSSALPWVAAVCAAGIHSAPGVSSGSSSDDSMALAVVAVLEVVVEVKRPPVPPRRNPFGTGADAAAAAAPSPS